jgi:hypothetical protein
VIYFISPAGESVVKIGRTGNIKQRMMELQTGNHRRLRLLGVVAEDPSSGITEANLHEKFSGGRIRNEWFDLTQDVADFIRDHCRRPRLGHAVVSPVGVVDLTCRVSASPRSWDYECHQTKQADASRRLAGYPAQCVLLIGMRAAIEALGASQSARSITLEIDDPFVADVVNKGQYLHWAERGWRYASGRKVAFATAWQKLADTIWRQNAQVKCVAVNGGAN